MMRGYIPAAVAAAGNLYPAEATGVSATQPISAPSSGFVIAVLVPKYIWLPVIVAQQTSSDGSPRIRGRHLEAKMVAGARRGWAGLSVVAPVVAVNVPGPTLAAKSDACSSGAYPLVNLVPALTAP
jgi:hypothetical protein